jgi:hypothetical protein
MLSFQYLIRVLLNQLLVTFGFMVTVLFDLTLSHKSQLSKLLSLSFLAQKVMQPYDKILYLTFFSIYQWT